MANRAKYRLFHYWRSSASWRARWALSWKGIDAELVHVSLLNGESESPEHLARNPMGYVPVLEFLERPASQPGRFLSESTAIVEWLEETYPERPFLPRDSWARAHIRSLCQIVNAGIQPLQNLNVVQRLSNNPDEQKSWCQHWIRHGLEAYEKTAKPWAGQWSFGDSPTMAELFLIPQCYASARFGIELEREYPLLHRIHRAALERPDCQRSAPDAHKPPEAS